jgi:hypothetical protein
MAKETPNVPEEDLRTDLEALLKAGRELGPDMDRALVDSYLARQRTAIQQTRRAAPRQDRPATVRQPWMGPHPLQVLMLAMVLAAVVSIAVISHGWVLWFIFPLFWMFGGWRRWGGGYRYRMAHRHPYDDWRYHDPSAHDIDSSRPVDYI